MMDEKQIQIEYANRISSRQPDLVAEWFIKTGVIPDDQNLERMLEVQERMQEINNVKTPRGRTPPVEIRYWNLYAAFKGIGSGNFPGEFRADDYR